MLRTARRLMVIVAVVMWVALIGTAAPGVAASYLARGFASCGTDAGCSCTAGDTQCTCSTGGGGCRASCVNGNSSMCVD